jgi:hypothetical protein
MQEAKMAAVALLFSMIFSGCPMGETFQEYAQACVSDDFFCPVEWTKDSNGQCYPDEQRPSLTTPLQPQNKDLSYYDSTIVKKIELLLLRSPSSSGRLQSNGNKISFADSPHHPI